MKVHKLVKVAGALAALWAVWRLYQARRRGVPWLLVFRFPAVSVEAIDQVNSSGVGERVRDELLAQMNAPRPATRNVKDALAK